jgi:mRNA interferase MazF
MALHTPFPDSGDIIHVNLAPSAGREMTGPHYALVLSSRDYAKTTGTVLVCPITSHIRGWPFEVLLPRGLLPPKKGEGLVDSVIHSDAVRQLDFRERGAAIVTTAPPAIVAEVRDILAQVLGIPIPEET